MVAGTIDTAISTTRKLFIAAVFRISVRIAHADAIACNGPATVNAVLLEITDPSRYDRGVHPNWQSQLPTPVDVQEYLSALADVSEKNQVITVSGYFRTFWDDKRLAFTGREDGGCFDQLVVRSADWEKLWQPDIYIANGAKQITGASQLVIYSTGRIYKTIHQIDTIQCPMDFTRLPFDHHTCGIKLSTYSQNGLEVVLRPKAGDNSMPGWDGSSKNASHKEWDILSRTATQYNQTFGVTPWSYVDLKLGIERKHFFYMITHVLNATAFVLISYTGFYINRAIAPARVAVSVIPVLIMRTLMNSVYSGLPRIGELTWLTNFIMICFFYCIVGVLEYGLVSYFMHNETVRVERYSELQEISRKIAKVQLPEAHAPVAVEPLYSNVPGGSRALQLTGEGMLNLEVEDSMAEARVPLDYRRNKLPSACIDTSSLAASQIDTLDALFCRLDKDSGAISRPQFRLVMRSYSRYYTIRQCDEIFEKHLGLQHGQDMQSREYLAFVKSMPAPAKDMKRAFIDNPPAYTTDIIMRYVFLSSFLAFALAFWLTSG